MTAPDQGHGGEHTSGRQRDAGTPHAKMTLQASLSELFPGVILPEAIADKLVEATVSEPVEDQESVGAWIASREPLLQFELLMRGCDVLFGNSPDGHVRVTGDTPWGSYVIDVPEGALPTSSDLDSAAKPTLDRLAPSSRHILKERVRTNLRNVEAGQQAMRQLAAARGDIMLTADPADPSTRTSNREERANYLVHALPRQLERQAHDAFASNDEETGVTVDYTLDLLGIEPNDVTRLALWEVIGRPRERRRHPWWWNRNGDLLLYLRRAVQKNIKRIERDRDLEGQFWRTRSKNNRPPPDVVSIHETSDLPADYDTAALAEVHESSLHQQAVLKELATESLPQEQARLLKCLETHRLPAEAIKAAGLDDAKGWSTWQSFQRKARRRLREKLAS